MHSDAPIISAKTVIQETNDETRLEMAYLLDYVDLERRRKSHWLHLPFLFRKLQSRTRNNICPNGCDGVFDPGNPLPNPWAGQPGPRALPQFEGNSLEEAKQLLKLLRSPVDAWLLYNQPEVINIIIGQPLLLYALVAQESLCIAPLTDCVKCIVLRFPYEGSQWGFKWSNDLVLLTSKKAMVKLPVFKVGDEDVDTDTPSEPASPMEVE